MSKTNATTLQAYDSAMQKYIDAMPPMSPEIKVWIDDNLDKLQKSSKILEIGTATGRDADYIESRGFTVERTDASRAFVDYQHSLGHQAKLLNVLTQDLGAGYDMVFADAVLLHFNAVELEEVLKKFYASLHENGRLVFSLKQGNGEEITTRKLDVERYFHYWQEADIRKLIAKQGFGAIHSVAHDDPRINKQRWIFISAVKKRNV